MLDTTMLRHHHMSVFEVICDAYVFFVLVCLLVVSSSYSCVHPDLTLVLFAGARHDCYATTTNLSLRLSAMLVVRKETGHTHKHTTRTTPQHTTRQEFRFCFLFFSRCSTQQCCATTKKLFLRPSAMKVVIPCLSSSCFQSFL